MILLDSGSKQQDRDGGVEAGIAMHASDWVGWWQVNKPRSLHNSMVELLWWGNLRPTMTLEH
jgi:hypothetical protein